MKKRKIKMTEEQIIVHAISMTINKWLLEKGRDVFKYSNNMTRNAEIATLIMDEGIPHAQAIIGRARSDGDKRLVDGGRLTVKSATSALDHQATCISK